MMRMFLDLRCGDDGFHPVADQAWDLAINLAGGFENRVAKAVHRGIAVALMILPCKPSRQAPLNRSGLICMVRALTMEAEKKRETRLNTPGRALW